MKKGGFNLHKWKTNDVYLQQRIDEAEGEIDGSERLNDKPIKILVLSCNNNSFTTWGSTSL